MTSIRSPLLRGWYCWRVEVSPSLNITGIYFRYLPLIVMKLKSPLCPDGEFIPKKASQSDRFLGLQTSFHLSSVPSGCLAVPPPLPCDRGHQHPLNQHFHRLHLHFKRDKGTKTHRNGEIFFLKKTNFAFPIPPFSSHVKRLLNLPNGKNLNLSPRSSNGNNDPWAFTWVWFSFFNDKFVRCCPLISARRESAETCPRTLIFPWEKWEFCGEKGLEGLLCTHQRWRQNAF